MLEKGGVWCVGERREVTIIEEEVEIGKKKKMMMSVDC